MNRLIYFPLQANFAEEIRFGDRLVRAIQSNSILSAVARPLAAGYLRSIDPVAIFAQHAFSVLGLRRAERSVWDRAAVRAGMVQREVNVLSEFNISREQIIAQYWGFTRLDPKRTNGNIAGQVRALDSLRDMLGFGAPQPGQKPDGEGEGDSKPQIYVAKWMRKPGDPDYEEDEGETAGSREISTRREPVMSDPEPPAKPARPAAVAQSSAVLPGGDTTNPPVEPTGLSRSRHGLGFGRFQGL